MERRRAMSMHASDRFVKEYKKRGETRQAAARGQTFTHWRTSRTTLVKTPRVNGLVSKNSLPPKSPLRRAAYSVYPDMNKTFKPGRI